MGCGGSKTGQAQPTEHNNNASFNWCATALRIPHLSARKDFNETLAKMGLQARGTVGVDGAWDISNADHLDNSEVNLVNIMVEGVAHVIRCEQAIEDKEDVEEMWARGFLTYYPGGLSKVVQNCPEWIRLGCGDYEYYCKEKEATFPGDKCPDSLPDLTDHNNMLADVLKENPDLYKKYNNTKTKMGVTLAKCIKTGIDNKGHPMITTCGLVGGDEESWTAFKDVFDPVIKKRHGGYLPNAVHTTDMDMSRLYKTGPLQIDPTGNYILTSRCRTGRSVKGFRLPPANTFEERRRLEKVIVDGLRNLKGDLEGDYFPLHGSRSYELKPLGMDEAKEEELRKGGNLFQEPDSTLLLSSGCGRHWPDARGIFHNDAKNFFVWVNEEDHMRIVSMEKGDDISKIMKRFADACKGVADVLQAKKYDFMHSEHLGYILTCPSNCGTGLRAGAMTKLPLVSAKKGFKETLARMGLQARGTAGVDSKSTGGTFDISNADRLGTSEVNLVNIMIEGVAKLIQWEQQLEKNESIDGEWATQGKPKPVAIE